VTPPIKIMSIASMFAKNGTLDEEFRDHGCLYLSVGATGVAASEVCSSGLTF
jgi:hypothetical protein